jgi:O-antigen ligase
LLFALGSFVLSILYSLGIGVDYVGERVTIFGENQNAIGSKMSISIVVLLLVILQNRLKLKWYRYLLCIPIPFLLKLMAETGSRIAFTQLALSLIIGSILFKTKNIRGKVVVFIISIFLILIMGIILMQSEIMMKRLFETVEDSALGGRSKIWSGIIPLIISNPIYGVGETGYKYYSMITFSKLTSPHNVILELICYTGLLGLTIYLVYIYQICKRGYQSYKKKGLLLPILLLLYVFGMLFTGQILYDKIGWIIFAYNVGSTSIHYDETMGSLQINQK